MVQCTSRKPENIWKYGTYMESGAEPAKDFWVVPQSEFPFLQPFKPSLGTCFLFVVNILFKKSVALIYNISLYSVVLINMHRLCINCFFIVTFFNPLPSGNSVAVS